MSEQNPAPGWYAAPHANNEQRYWDGSQWVDHSAQAFSSPADTAAVTRPARRIAIAALIVGIVAFLTGLIPVVGMVIGVVAILLGIIALIRKQPKGMAITALGLGVIAAIASISTTVGLISLASNAPRPAAVASSPSAAAEGPSEPPATSPEPEPTTEPQAPAAPLVARQDFTGTGDMVLDVNITEAAIVTFSCADCTRNTVLKTNGAESLLVNTIGAYAGSHLININVGSMTTQMVVESTGNWSLTIDDVSSAPVADTTTWGTGDTVVIFTGEFDAAAIVNQAGSNFVVRAYGDGNWSPLIVNEIGAYSGTVEMSAPAVVQVISEGDWSITGQ